MRSRCEFLRLPCAGAAASLLLGAAISADADRPNVVIVYADDMGFGDMGAYAQRYGTTPPAPTPHMDALAAEGLMFTQAHSSNAVCTPSRYALLTGKYNWRTFSGISVNFAAPDIPAEDTTLAEFLKTQGYDTAAFGKWHLGGYFYRPDGTPYTERNNSVTNQADVDWEHPLVGHATDNGFDVFRGLASSINLLPYVYVRENRIQYYDAALGAFRDARNTDSFHSFTKAELDAGLTVGTESRAGLGDPSYRQIDADPFMVEEFEAYMRGRVGDEDPFFAYVALYSPHAPWHTTDPFKGSVGFPFGDFMAEVDHRIGRIIAAVDTNGFRNSTLVVLTSDNGPETAAYLNSRSNGRDSNGPLRGIKRDAWEGGTRVPFIVRWPGQVAEPGGVSDELIWQGDIFATVAAHLGADLPPDVVPDGESFLNLLRGQNKPAQRRDSVVVASINDHRAVIFTDGWKLVDSTRGGGNSTSYDSSDNAISNAIGTDRGEPKQLYYLPDDLGENTNRIAAVTGEQNIRNQLIALTGRDLLARLDAYRAEFTSALFPPFPDNDLDGMPNQFENQYPGLDRDDPSDRDLDFEPDDLTNLEEYLDGTHPDDPDSDGDGLPDGYEAKVSGTLPNNPDSDGDGVSDGDEALLYGTDPLDPDTDEDGVGDGTELAAVSNPRNPDDKPVPPSPSAVVLSPSVVQLAGVDGTADDPAVSGEYGWPEAGTLYVRERIVSGHDQQWRTCLFLKFDLSSVAGSIEEARLRVHQKDKLNDLSDPDRTSDLELARVTAPWRAEAGSYPQFAGTAVADAFRFGNNQDFGAAKTSQGFYGGAPGAASAPGGFDPEGRVTALVSLWVADSNANHGVRIRMTDRSYAGVAFSDADDPATPDDERLQLLLTVQPPAESLDTDGDGLPDAWERAHAADLSVFDGSGDEDDDGYSNAVELAAGSAIEDPEDKPSLQVALSSAAMPDGLIRFRRYRRGNYGYEMHVSADLKTWVPRLGVLEEHSVTVDVDDPDYEVVTYRLAAAPTERLYVRLRLHVGAFP